MGELLYVNEGFLVASLCRNDNVKPIRILSQIQLFRPENAWMVRADAKALHVS